MKNLYQKIVDETLGDIDDKMLELLDSKISFLATQEA
jgi:hypothetical protein